MADSEAKGSQNTTYTQTKTQNRLSDAFAFLYESKLSNFQHLGLFAATWNNSKCFL